MNYTGTKRGWRGGASLVVYLDVVWIINFFMDALLLFTTVWVAKRTVRIRRIFLAAVLGAMYAMTVFVPALAVLTTWVGKVLVSFLMVALAVPWHNWLDLARVCVLYYFVAFSMAGAALAVHFAVPSVGLGKALWITGAGLTFGVVLSGLGLLAAIPLAIGTVRFGLIRMHRSRRQHILLRRIRITLNGISVVCVGLADTGNQLRDSVSRRPVCLVESGVLSPLLPAELQAHCQKGGDLLQGLEQLHPQWMRRVSLIPWRGAGGTNQITVAIRPDLLEVEERGRWRDAASPPLVAIITHKLSSDNQFEAILHTDVIMEDEQGEPHIERHQPQTADSSTATLDPGTDEIRGRI